MSCSANGDSRKFRWESCPGQVRAELIIGRSENMIRGCFFYNRLCGCLGFGNLVRPILVKFVLFETIFLDKPETPGAVRRG